MYYLYATKVVANRDLPSFVDTLNARTREGHVMRAARITPILWLLQIRSRWADDIEFVRAHL